MKPRRYIRPRPRSKPSTMNKLEAAYAENLEMTRRFASNPAFSHGLIAWKFDAIKLRLAKRTWYTPDFLVVTTDAIELHEVKGHWEDDARVKWKVAAESYPWFRFVAVTQKKGAWHYENAD
jgi:hypothetical protein